jgi:hypothetical protein
MSDSSSFVALAEHARGVGDSCGVRPRQRAGVRSCRADFSDVISGRACWSRLSSRSAGGRVKPRYGYDGGGLDLVRRGAVLTADLSGAKARCFCQMVALGLVAEANAAANHQTGAWAGLTGFRLGLPASASGFRLLRAEDDGVLVA